MARCIAAMRRWPRDQKSKLEVNSHDVIKWRSEAYVRRNLAQNINATLSSRWNGQININWKYKMAAAAILNFRKTVSVSGLDRDILHQLIWEDASRPRGYDHMTKSRNRKVIRVTSSNECLKHMYVNFSDYNIYLIQIWHRTQAPQYIHAGMAKFT